MYALWFRRYMHAYGATNVAISVQPSVTFTEPMDGATKSDEAALTKSTERPGDACALGERIL